MIVDKSVKTIIDKECLFHKWCWENLHKSEVVSFPYIIYKN